MELLDLRRLAGSLSRLSYRSVDSARATRDSLLGRRWMPAWLMTWGKHLLSVARFLAVIFGGILLGTLMLSPTKDLVISILAISVYLVVIVTNPVNGVLLWVIAYPFTESSINIPLGAGIPDLSPTRFCVAFMSTMLLAQAAIGKRRFPRITKSDVAAMLFFAGTSLSIAASTDPIGSFQVIFDLYLISILGYFLAKNLVLNRRDVEKVLTAFLVIGAYAGVYAIYEQLTGNILFATKEYELTQYTENIRILRGLFGGPHVFSSIFAFALPMGFYRFLETRRSLKKNGYAILVGLMLVAMFYTYKRASWVSMMVSFLIMQAFYPKFRRIFWVLVIIFSLVLVITWDQVSQSEVYTERVSEDWETGHGRTDRAAVAIELWKEKPIFGYGFNQFEDVSDFDAVENFYLHILVSAGLVGFLPFVAFLVLIVKDSILVYRQAPYNPSLFLDRKLVVVFWAAFSTYLVKSLSGAQQQAIVQYLFYALIGVMVGSQGELIESRKSDAPVLAATLLDTGVQP
jgi:O-antigen ligase